MTVHVPADWRTTPPPYENRMAWAEEPIYACIDTGQTRAQVFQRALRNEFDSMDDSRWVDLRARRVYLRWAAGEIADDYERDNCPCWDKCPGEAMCGRKRVRHIDDIWNEYGEHCPWVQCSKDHPDAQRWWVVWDSSYAEFPYLVKDAFTGSAAPW